MNSFILPLQIQTYSICITRKSFSKIWDFLPRTVSKGRYADIDCKVSGQTIQPLHYPAPEKQTIWSSTPTVGGPNHMESLTEEWYHSITAAQLQSEWRLLSAQNPKIERCLEVAFFYVFQRSIYSMRFSALNMPKSSQLA